MSDLSDLSDPALSLVPLEGAEPLLPTALVPGASAVPSGPARRAEPFAWPTPPLAAYAPPVCQIEPEPCEVEARTGQAMVGQLISFDPVEGVVRVLLPPERAPMPLRFVQMTQLRLSRPLLPLVATAIGASAPEPDDARAQVLRHWPSQPYEVELVSGVQLSGRTVGHVEHECGLFLFPPLDETTGSVARVFIPKTLIVKSELGERLGLLLAEGETTQIDKIEEVARLQRSLRDQRLGEALVEQEVVNIDQLLAALDKQARMPMMRLGEALVALGYLSDDQLKQALRQQRDHRAQPLGELLRQRGLVSVDQVRSALARKLGYPVVDVSHFPAEPEALQALSGQAARRLAALPLMRRGSRLMVAMEDPSQRAVLDELARETRCQIAPALAGEGDLQAAIDAAYRASPMAAPAFNILDIQDAHGALDDAVHSLAAPLADDAAVPSVSALDALLAASDAADQQLADDLNWPALGAEAEAGKPASAPARDERRRPGEDHPAPPASDLPVRSTSKRAAPAPAKAAATKPAAGKKSDTGAVRSDTRPESPLLQLLAELVQEAQQRGAHSLHIEQLPDQDKLQVRLRVDGRLEALRELPAAYRTALPARIKTLAELDVTETRLAQLGRLPLGRLIPGQKAELQITTLPTQVGVEDLIIHLPARLKPMPIDGIGLAAHDLERLRATLDRPSGLWLCAGPARSGRTTTLHAALAHLNRSDRLVCAIEPRIELNHPGVRQVEINPRAGHDYEQALRAVMQADADVIMVADLSRPAVSRLALEAALEGRLVLGALPARNSTEAVMRLIDQGLDAWSLSEALLGVHAQRLVKRLCSSCRMSRPAKELEVAEWTEGYLQGTPADDPATQREQLHIGWLTRFGRDGRLRRYHSPGCERCQSTGLRGRVAVHELLVVSRELRRLIRAGAPSWNLQRQAMKDGMHTLRQDAVDKMLGGLLSMDEVRTVADL